MLIPREQYLNKIKRAISSVPITVLIGARQVGKTSLLNSIQYDKLTVQFDGQMIETKELFANESGIIQYLKIHLNEQLEGYLIIDEFQMINGISNILKILVDNFPKLKVLCSGSSSIDIVQKINESLAGRLRIIDVYSLSFSESIYFYYGEALYNNYLKYSIDTDVKVIPESIKLLLNEHLIYGGMPKVWLTKDEKEKKQIIFDIYRTYLLRDIKYYVKNEDSVGFNKILKMLSLQIGNLVNINELSNISGLKYYKCEEYLYLLEQMYIIKLVYPFSVNKRRAIKKMKKVYFLDLGIRNMIIKNFNIPNEREDNGALLENFVFLELLKKAESYFNIEFFRTIDGTEVDFIMNDLIKTTSIEVKNKSLRKPVFYKSLKNFNEELNIKDSYLINMNLNYKMDNIRYLPVYLTEKLFSNK